MYSSAKFWMSVISTCLLLDVNFSHPAATFAQQREESETETIQAGKPVPLESVPNLNAVADRIVQLTNEFREREELQAVKSNPELDATADYFAKFMAAHDKYGHTADGQRPSERAKQHGYPFCIVLENIAYQYSSVGFEADELAQGFAEGWKNSPEHRKNMLDPDVLETGVAVGFSDKTGHFFAVQMFGRPRSATIRFQLANRSESIVYYAIGKQKFVLEPLYTRTHERCRPSGLKFHGTEINDIQPDQVLEPRNGDGFVVKKNATGDVIIERDSKRS